LRRDREVSRFIVFARSPADTGSSARTLIPPPPLTEGARQALIATLQNDVAIAEYRLEEATIVLDGLRKRLEDLLDD
jgi:hypothetical protein